MGWSDYFTEAAGGLAGAAGAAYFKKSPLLGAVAGAGLAHLGESYFNGNRSMSADANSAGSFLSDSFQTVSTIFGDLFKNYPLMATAISAIAGYAIGNGLGGGLGGIAGAVIAGTLANQYGNSQQEPTASPAAAVAQQAEAPSLALRAPAPAGP